MTHVLPPMIDAKLVAMALNISEPGVYEMARRNALPFKSYKLGRSVRFRRVDVERYVGMPLVELFDDVAE